MFDKASIRKNLCRKIHFFVAPIRKHLESKTAKIYVAKCLIKPQLQKFMSHSFIPALIYGLKVGYANYGLWMNKYM